MCIRERGPHVEVQAVLVGAGLVLQPGVLVLRAALAERGGGAQIRPRIGLLRRLPAQRPDGRLGVRNPGELPAVADRRALDVAVGELDDRGIFGDLGPVDGPVVAATGPQRDRAAEDEQTGICLLYTS